MKKIFGILFFLVAFSFTLYLSSCGPNGEIEPVSEDVRITAKKLETLSCWKLDTIWSPGPDLSSGISSDEISEYTSVPILEYVAFSTDGLPEDHFTAAVYNQFNFEIAEPERQEPNGDTLIIAGVKYYINDFSEIVGYLHLSRRVSNEKANDGSSIELNYELSGGHECLDILPTEDLTESEIIDCWFLENGFDQEGQNRPHMKFKEDNEVISFFTDSEGNEVQQVQRWEYDQDFNTIKIGDVTWTVTGVTAERLLLTNIHTDRQNNLITNRLVLVRSTDCPPEEFRNTLSAVMTGLPSSDFNANSVEFLITDDTPTVKYWTILAFDDLAGAGEYTITIIIDENNGVDQSYISFHAEDANDSYNYIVVSQSITYEEKEDGIVEGTFSFMATDFDKDLHVSAENGTFRLKKD